MERTAKASTASSTRPPSAPQPRLGNSPPWPISPLVHSATLREGVAEGQDERATTAKEPNRPHTNHKQERGGQDG